jgi:hypothetical protein
MTPVMTDVLACDSSITCIKDSQCMTQNGIESVLKTPCMLSLITLSFALDFYSLALILLPLSLPLAPSPIELASSFMTHTLL